MVHEKGIEDIHSILKPHIEFSSLFTTPSQMGRDHDASFDGDLSGLCGLARRDVQEAFELLPPTAESVTRDIEPVYGYHFCGCKKVDPV